MKNTCVVPLAKLSKEEMKILKGKYGEKLPKEATGLKMVDHFDDYGNLVGQESFLVTEKGSRIPTPAEIMMQAKKVLGK